MSRLICFAALIYCSLMTGQSSALERLFTTPEQRDQLDRRIKKQPAPIEATRTDNNHSIHLNGFVKTPVRNTVWINGSMQKRDETSAYSVQPGIFSSNQVTLTVQGTRVRIRPGQELIDRRVIKDVYENRMTASHDTPIQQHDENAVEPIDRARNGQ